jgi:ABC-type phosphate/phosphonate transport system substrate-binding protein
MIPAMPTPIVVGAVAYDPKVVTIWELCREWFAARGAPVDYRLFSSYEAQVEALLARHIDIAWNTNVAWLRVKKRTDGRARAIAMRDTDVGFTTKLIARAGLPINGPADLRGRTVALGSADSGQAAILPVHFLRQAGLVEQQDYKSIRFDLDVGKHGDTGTSELEVLAAIADGRADAGPVGDTTWATLLANRAVDTSKVRAVWTSPPYHHCNFTVLPDYPEERARAFTDALFAMKYDEPAGKKIMDLEGLREWVKGRTEGYAVLEDAMKTQGLL